MNDSTELLVTLAQLGGGFVAIVSGFIFSKLLTLSTEMTEINQKNRKLHRKHMDEVKKYDITVDDLINGRKKEELVQAALATKDAFRDLTVKEARVKDPVILLRAFLALAPMVIFGICIPLIYLAGRRVQLGDTEVTLVLAGFFLGVFSIIGYIFWFAYRIYSEW